jgi:uncharacterized protein with GYD domain
VPGCFHSQYFLADLLAKLSGFACKLTVNLQLGAERRQKMPTYISLLKLTDQGIKNIKEAPARVEEGIKAMEAGGGKFIGFYSVMGEYDYVIIGEAPSDEAMMTYLLALGSLGNVRTTTMKAFNKEQFSDFVKKLP